MSVSPDGIRFRWSAVKRVLPWLLAGSAVGGGGAGGYFGGLRAEAAERANMKAQARENTRRLDELQAELTQTRERLARAEQAVQSVSAALAAEAQSNRSERGTRDRQLEELRARLPKIEGLARPP